MYSEVSGCKVMSSPLYNFHVVKFACTQGHGGPKHEPAHGRAIGAATLSYFRNRASSPRDMSAAAAAEMRRACDAVLADIY